MLVGGPLLTGCSLVTSPFQERGASGYLEDTKLRLLLNEALLIKGSDVPERVEQVEFMVDRGRVLLLGMVDNLKTKAKAVAMVRKVPGIRTILTEIEIGPETGMSYAKDAILGQRFEALLLLDPYIFSQNYHIKAVNGIIYVLGTARSQKEVERLLEHADGLQARRVVLHVQNNFS